MPSCRNGAVFGQESAVAGGTLKRLYVKLAAGGSIRAPDLAAGDATVARRSLQLGLPIQPGRTYVYQVFYRDPLVLGACPSSSTFNATQAGTISWWP
ncbi:MAG: hypothetical protein IPJ19_21455 [Planctomycetes bacterium]|nr:hypothetical protein [Planctomycetota bacterium]